MSDKENESSFAEIETLKSRLKSVETIHLRERSELADQVKLLLKENYELRKGSSSTSLKNKSEKYLPLSKVEHPERDLGLDFSLPEEQGKDKR